MSNLEHYFENLLFEGKDVIGDVNKNSLTKEEQTAVEVCANYVLFTLFCGRDELKEALVAEPIRHGHWVEQEQDDWRYSKEYRCSECGKYRLVTNPVGWEWHYCPHCGAKMDEVV